MLTQHTEVLSFRLQEDAPLAYTPAPQTLRTPYMHIYAQICMEIFTLTFPAEGRMILLSPQPFPPKSSTQWQKRKSCHATANSSPSRLPPHASPISSPPPPLWLPLVCIFIASAGSDRRASRMSCKTGTSCCSCTATSLPFPCL